MKDTLSMKTSHFFHVVSNIRPIIWIGAYVAVMPLFAFIYWALPDAQFRIPDGAATDYWSWLYYSIVTETTLGFGDYTPAHVWAQIFTAIEVMFGLVLIGFFLNAVGSMKSEIDVESEVEKRRRAHIEMEKQKLTVSIPALKHTLNNFLEYCYAVTTPLAKRNDGNSEYNPDFKFSDMQDLFQPSGLPFDVTRMPAVARLVKSASHTSLALDSLQNRIDLTIWPDILDNCFGFVANFQMFSASDSLSGKASDLISTNADGMKESEAQLALQKEIASFAGDPSNDVPANLRPIAELYFFIKENAEKAVKLEQDLNSLTTPEA